MSCNGFIGVHVGAGNHAIKKTLAYQETCKDACRKACETLAQGKSATEAVVEAVKVLENAYCTNAGYGSNLTLDGKVECDASVMDGSSLKFAAVGALPGVRNPILVAHSLLRQQIEGDLPLGLIPPSLLVGIGAREWAISQDIPTCTEEQLLTESALRTYKHYKRKLKTFREEEELAAPPPVKKRNLEDLCNVESSRDELFDTVGAVCLDSEGNVTSAVSSGGLLLKHPGRIGQASMYGCGAWAQNAGPESDSAIAVSTSGCGEYLTRTMFARESAFDLANGEFPNAVFQKKFVDSPFLKGIDQKLAGAIVLRYTPQEGKGEFTWVHNTSSMCVGFMSTADKNPKIYMSRLPDPSKAGHTVAMEGTRFSFK